MKNKKEHIILYLLLAVGITLTLIYIFRTSTAILNSDSVITDVIAHNQRLTGQFILKDWYYGNEFWLFSLTIPTYILSFVIKNNLLLRQICVLITGIIFFILLYIYGKKFLSKKDTLLLITIFASGISYSVLDYFYAFNAYLTVVINSIILFFLYYKSFEEKEKNKLYLVLSIIFTFLFSMGSLRYIPTVTIPFILTELLLLFISNYKNNNMLKKIIRDKKINAICILVIGSMVSLLMYKYITMTYHFEARASSGNISTSFQIDYLIEAFKSLMGCIYNFFGFDNKNHPYTLFIGKYYFLKQHKDFSFLSLTGIAYIIKMIMCSFVIVLCPIILLKNYKKNNKNINFLLIFNAISWIILIYIFIVSSSFFHHYLELKYFLFNILINFILALYCISKYYNKLIHILIILYIISNLYTNYIVIREHNDKVINKRIKLVEKLKENNLTFGYGEFWEGLIINFFSDYKIEVATMQYDMQPYRWYSKESIYKKNYHKGKVFIIFNKINDFRKHYYEFKYGKADKTIKYDQYTILIYNKNPLVNGFKEVKHEKITYYNNSLFE